MKKTKANEKILALYENLEVPNKKSSNRAIVVGANGETFVLPDKSVIGKFPELVIAETIESLDWLLDQTESLIAAHHERVFKVGIPKGVDKTHAALMTFAWYIRNAKPLIPQVTKNADGVKQEKVRASTIGTRIYTLGDVRDINAIKTPQAKACYTILVESLSKVESEGDVPHVTEENLRKCVEARAAELKTKQDPWRIFQYYRPVMLASKMLKHD